MKFSVASFGGGVNSTAMLVGLQERDESVDLILFSDTGGESPETYAWVEHFSKWLAGKGFPGITWVKSPNETLEAMCLRLGVLPPIAFGFKTCSLRFKIEPQHKFLNNYQPAKDALSAGDKITKLIGFDAGEPHRVRESEDPKYINRYPLVEWQWTRDECIAALERNGLCVPPKSSCFFCPHFKPAEVIRLKTEHPDLYERALEIERRAMPRLTSVKGLGRTAFSWAEIGANDDAQMKLISIVVPQQPCECYDGE